MLVQNQLGASLAAMYTLPSGKVTNIKSIILHNTNSTTEIITLCIVPNGSTAGTTNQILNIALASGDTFEFSPSYPFVLRTAGQTLQGRSTTAAKVNFFVMGTESNV